MARAAYVHIPFCAHKCDFCDFAVVVGLDERQEKYCLTVAREIEQRLAAQTCSRTLNSVYYGGGTPGYIDTDYLEVIHSRLRENPGIEADAEVTLETTPGSISRDKAERWLELGINRLSVGVESLSDRELSASGRAESRQQCLNGLEIALAAGFTSVGVDLIYGLPEQTLASFGATLSEVLSMPIQHLSAYGLTLAGNSPLLRRYPRTSPAYPDEDAFASMYMLLVEMAASAGLRQYEISNFSRPGFESVHNLVYWSNEEYFGFGVSAHRYVGGVRSANYRSFNRYMSDCLGSEFAEVIDADRRRREAIFLALRTRSGLDLTSFEQEHGLDFVVKYNTKIQRLLEGGFAEISEGRFRLTHRGVLVSNTVMSEFM